MHICNTSEYGIISKGIYCHRVHSEWGNLDPVPRCREEIPGVSKP